MPTRCVFCKHEFVLAPPSATVAPTRIAASVAATGGGTKSPVAVIAGAAVVLMAVTSTLLFTAGGKPSPQSGPLALAPYVSQTPSPPAMPIVPVGVAPAATPSAQLGEVAEGHTSIGGRFWLVEYVNTGTVEITTPSVVASGFDAAGARIVEQSGYANRSRLAPGEKVVILVLIADPPAQLARVEVSPRPPETSGYAARELPVAILESSERPSMGAMHDLVGTLRNEGTDPLRFVRIIAVGRDANDKPVSFADGIPTRNDLGPGEQTGFELSVGTFEISRPVRWELVGFGQAR